jgi:ribosomal protein S18 acetylase RimI-like enzyme
VEASALALRGHENWIAYLAASISLSPEGVVSRDRGVVALLGHVPLRFFNQVLVDAPPANASAIRDAVSRARQRHDPFAVSLRAGVDDEFTLLMGELGLVAADDAATLAMTLHPLRSRPQPAAPEPGFEIRRVTDEAGLEDHRRAVSAGFGSDESVADTMIRIGLLDRSECVIYAGYLDGVPVTSGTGWRTGRTMGVYNIATVPAARRRGFGEAMTARILADGEAAGCDVAVLQASAMGRPIYERLGFRDTTRYIGYVDPPRGKR